MKYILILILIVSTVLAVKGQDNIILKDGSEIESKIVEISIDVIQYRLYNNLEGPIIEIPRNQVFLIDFKNGTRQIITPDERAYYYTAKKEENGRPFKSMGGAIALSVIFPGGGQYYLRSKKAGLLMTGVHFIGYSTIMVGFLQSITEGFTNNEEEAHTDDFNPTFRNGIIITSLNYVHNLVDVIIRSKRYKEGKNMWGMNKEIRLTPQVFMSPDGTLTSGATLAWTF